MTSAKYRPPSAISDPDGPDLEATVITRDGSGRRIRMTEPSPWTPTPPLLRGQRGSAFRVFRAFRGGKSGASKAPRATGRRDAYPPLAPRATSLRIPCDPRLLLSRQRAISESWSRFGNQSLNGLDPNARREALTQVYWSWAEGDPKGFSAHLSTLPGQEASEPILSTTAQNLARLNPREALEWAGKLNEGVRDRTLSTAFSTWLSSQPKTAMEWLRLLDGSDPRRVPVMAGAVSSALPWQVQNGHPGVGESMANPC